MYNIEEAIRLLKEALANLEEEKVYRAMGAQKSRRPACHFCGNAISGVGYCSCAITDGIYCSPSCLDKAERDHRMSTYGIR